MTQDEAFLSAILAAPDDVAPRLIYADWLLERGDPRGEFIQVQCRLAALAADDPQRPLLEERERYLLSEHRHAWEQPVRSLGARPAFSRGFIEGLTLDVGAFLDHGEDLLNQVPLRSAWLHQATGSGERLARSPLLSRLSELNLSGHPLTEEDVAALARSPFLQNVTRLSLMGTDLTCAMVRALAASPHLPRLRELNLQMNRIGADGSKALAESPNLARLTGLNLYHNRTGDDGAEAVARSAGMKRLVLLNLGDNRLSDVGGLALASTAHLERVDHLRLYGNLISPAVRDRLIQRFGNRVKV